MCEHVARTDHYFSPSAENCHWVALNCVDPCFISQGLDEEALVDYGKTSFTTQTNYEKEDLESK